MSRAALDRHRSFALAAPRGNRRRGEAIEKACIINSLHAFCGRFCMAFWHRAAYGTCNNAPQRQFCDNMLLAAAAACSEKRIDLRVVLSVSAPFMSPEPSSGGIEVVPREGMAARMAHRGGGRPIPYIEAACARARGRKWHHQQGASEMPTSFLLGVSAAAENARAQAPRAEIGAIIIEPYSLLLAYRRAWPGGGLPAASSPESAANRRRHVAGDRWCAPAAHRALRRVLL